MTTGSCFEQRVNSLLTRSGHAEYPALGDTSPRQQRPGDGADGDRLHVFANFTVYRVRSGVLDTYAGQYRHIVERDEVAGFRFVNRRSVLVLDALRPHGKVSIIL